MDDKLQIELRVMQKTYPMIIDRRHEELYRRAEELVNQQVSELLSMRYDGYSIEDYIAVALLYLAAENVTLRTSGELEKGDMKRIQDISSKIEKSFI